MCQTMFMKTTLVRAIIVLSASLFTMLGLGSNPAFAQSENLRGVTPCIHPLLSSLAIVDNLSSNASKKLSDDIFTLLKSRLSQAGIVYLENVENCKIVFYGLFSNKVENLGRTWTTSVSVADLKTTYPSYVTIWSYDQVGHTILNGQALANFMLEKAGLAINYFIQDFREANPVQTTSNSSLLNSLRTIPLVTVGIPVDTTSFSSGFTHDGTLFVASDYTGKISVIRVSDGIIQNTFQAGSDYIRRLSLSIDDHILATEQRYGTIKLWNLHTGEEIREFDNWSNESLGVEIAFNPMNSNTLAILSKSSLFLLDVVTNQMVKFELGGYSLAWSPDGQRLAITRVDGIHDVTIFDVSSMHPLLEWSAKNDWDFITSLKFSSDGLMLAGTDSVPAKVALWDLRTGLLRFEVGVPTAKNNISSLAFSPNDLFLVAAGDNPGVVLKVETGESVAKIETNQTVLNGVWFTPNGFVLGLGFALLRDPQGRSLEDVFQER